MVLARTRVDATTHDTFEVGHVRKRHELLKDISHPRPMVIKAQEWAHLLKGALVMINIIFLRHLW